MTLNHDRLQRTPIVSLSDKLSAITHHHLHTRVPVKLEFDDWNYASLQFFFEQLCDTYDVSKFIHGTNSGANTSTPAPLTPEEQKVDKIILSWIFATLSDSLQKRDLVKDNKWSRTSALKTELRSIKLGSLTMEAYFQKIESIMTILASLDSPVSDEDAVHYALDGLPDTYNQVCGYMHYKDTFPDLKTARSMLVTEEMRLKSKSFASPVDLSSFSHVVLLTKKGNNRHPSNPQVKHMSRVVESKEPSEETIMRVLSKLGLTNNLTLQSANNRQQHNLAIGPSACLTTQSPTPFNYYSSPVRTPPGFSPPQARFNPTPYYMQPTSVPPGFEPQQPPSMPTGTVHQPQTGPTAPPFAPTTIQASHVSSIGQPPYHSRKICDHSIPQPRCIKGMK
ncbi:hypothetical protein CTI12_AA386390 [Artemisia annua]|uniref:Hybrid signal transduction histidine kinase M n=1 Tax=Artemisia annua TaxID=35608 RepID=A0A2U1MFC8_ARTAN|nr:hypothetical protein CTI12_AA386390 [Artemisia annua]